MLKHTRIFLPSLIYIIIHLPVIVNCQESSFRFTYSTNQDEMAIAAIETNTGDFLVSCRQGYHNLSLYHVLLLKISPEGDTVKSLTILNQEGTCSINTIVPSGDGNYFGIGSWKQSVTETSVWIVKITPDLEILWSKYGLTGLSMVDVVKGLRSTNGELLLYGDGSIGDSTSYDMFIYRLSSAGDSILFRKFPDTGSELVFSLSEIPDSSGFIMSILGKYQPGLYSFGQFIYFGNDLEILKADSIPGRMFMYYNTLYDRRNLIITGIKVIPQPPHAMNLLGIEKLDTANSILSSAAFGSMDIDTLSYPGYIQNIDTTNDGCFFYGGTFNQDNYFEFSYFKSWIMINALDSSFNLKWQKFYGGDKYYGLWGVKSVSDGGCLLLCSTFDYTTQSEERDILIMKIDSSGTLTGTNTDQKLSFKEILVYPNPGSKLITLRSAMLDYDFRMMDVNGKLVCSKKISAATEEINTETLPSGIYLYTISKEQKIIETGKWVKK